MSQDPRIIIFSGKGGVGKTTAAAATAVLCSRLNLKTLLLSVDIAHSLADSFALNVDLHDHNRGSAREITENLWIQEIDIQEELDRNWGEVSNYLAALLGASGMTQVLAHELAVIPGMEDVISLLYINQYFHNRSFDVLVIDCAPTGESLRFISMPSTLEWYINKVFKLERNLMRAVRPFAKRLTDIPMPADSYFASLQDLFYKLDGVDKVLLDPKITTVRLVTNAERMVVRETQRAFMYFSLYGLSVDSVIVNKLFPENLTEPFFQNWLTSQKKSMLQIQSIFGSIPIRPVEILGDEVVGLNQLTIMGKQIYGKQNPSDIFHNEPVYEVTENGKDYIMRMKLPFVSKDYIDLAKENGDLIVRIGSFKRHIFLPRTLEMSTPSGAQLENGTLSITFVKDAK